MLNTVPDDGVLVRNARLAVKAELQKKRTLKLPIAKYDPKTKTVYMLNPDGTTTFLAGEEEMASECHE